MAAEELERRENPAGGSATPEFWWAPDPADLSASTPTNWMKGPSGPVDQWDRAPGQLDGLHFQNTAAGNYDCLVPMGVTTAAPASDGTPPTMPSNTFAGIHLMSGYTKTVELQKSVAVGALEVTSGAIKQNDSTAISALTYVGNQHLLLDRRDSEQGVGGRQHLPDCRCHRYRRAD